MSEQILNTISGRLSLRAPQRASLEALKSAIDATAVNHQKSELLNPGHDVHALLEMLKAQFPTLDSFEREFPSLCFALATGVGKTRLMGAFISYLHLAHGVNHYFVLAPNLTIYEKLIADFTPNTPKYVFKGVSEFAAYPPALVTGDNYETVGASLGMFSHVTINIFNIAKIVSEIRGGKAPRIKRLSEYLGDSYFNALSELDDLVLLMDESHRYRASAGMKAINELNPILGLELTATPFTETGRGTKAFKNIVVHYPLACAMEDGFVKEPAVVTQRNFNAGDHSPPEIERIKLMDGIRLHEQTRVELTTYAKQNGVARVKPFMLVIAHDTDHARQLRESLESDDFFAGHYKGKVIQVDSSCTGAAEQEMITRLLAVEHVEEPTEIVIHVNMLKEGWDVTNLYTIVPLRPAKARVLIEQSIGRGLRLPYGRRTGVDAVDRLSIIAHDRFQEIVDEANNPDNPLRLQKVFLDAPQDDKPKESLTILSNLEAAVTGDASVTGMGYKRGDGETLAFNNERERQIAETTWKILNEFQHRPMQAPVSRALLSDDLQASIVDAVSAEMSSGQEPFLAAVLRTTTFMVSQSIDIPRIVVVPIGEVCHGYRDFTLDMDSLSLQPSERELISQSLQSNRQLAICARPQRKYDRLEDYIVEHLLDKDDMAYDEHADIIYRAASEALAFFRDTGEYSEDELHNIFFDHGRLIAEHIHAQMAEHYWEEAAGYEVKVNAGFTPLKRAVYTKAADTPVRHYRQTVNDVSRIRGMLFDGFKRCLYPLQKFDSDTERRFAIILERDAMKWFKPVSGQFQIFYKDGLVQKEYHPDFVAELDDRILMVETKAEKDMQDPVVLAKAEAAREWCDKASEYLLEHDGKPWRYLLVPHAAVLEANALKSLIDKFQTQ